jgi:hypothetical protein
MALNIGISLSISITSLEVSLQLCDDANKESVATIFSRVHLLVWCRTNEHKTCFGKAFLWCVGHLAYLLTSRIQLRIRNQRNLLQNKLTGASCTVPNFLFYNSLVKLLQNRSGVRCKKFYCHLQEVFNFSMNRTGIHNQQIFSILLTIFIYSMNNSNVIHGDLFALQITCRPFKEKLFKRLCWFALLITNGGSFSPVTLAANKTVNLSLEFLPLL